jgi:CHAT domain-containing protein/tetratricopeptide (TPR) repeat protein
MKPTGAAVPFGIVALALCLASGAGRAADPPAPAAADPLEAIRAQLKAGHYPEAEAAARALLAAVEADKGPDSVETAAVLDLLVESRWRGGRTRDPEVQAFARRAVAIKEKALGPEHLEVAVSLNNLGNALLRAEDLDGARAAFERILLIRERSLGPDHPDVAKVLNNLSVLAEREGDYAKARALAERALGIMEKRYGPDSISLIEILNNLAGIQGIMDERAEAIRLHRRCQGIIEKNLGPDHPQMAVSLSNLGIQLRVTGDYIGARKAYERALAIKEKVLGPDSPSVASTLHSLGTLLLFMGDLAAARPLIERAIAIQEEAQGPGSPDLTESLNTLGRLLYQQGDYAAAKPILEKAVANAGKTLGPEHPDLRGPLGNLASVLSAQGDYAGARPLLERSLAIAEKSFGPDNIFTADIVEAMGDLLIKEGELDAARRRYERAFSIRENALGPAHPEVAATLENISAVQLYRGAFREAIGRALQAEALTREQFRATARSLPENQALRYETVRVSGLAVAVSALAAEAGTTVAGEDARRVWDAMARSRAMVLDEMAARHRQFGAPGDPEAASLADALRETRDRLARLVVAGPGPEEPKAYRELLAKAQRDRERAEAAVAEHSADFRRERARSLAGLEDAARAMPPGSALVAYVSYERLWRVPPGADHPTPPPEPLSSYLALVLRADVRDPTVVPLGPARPIDAALDRWRREAGTAPGGLSISGGRAEARYRKAGESLRRLIWDPLAARLQGTRLVFVVPDGPLNLVSLASLPVGPDRYLLETGPTLHYLSAERDLIDASGRGANGRGLLALGGPDYDVRSSSPPSPGGATADGAAPASGRIAAARATYRGPRSACGDFRTLRFDPLPGARVEAEEVASLWESKGGVSGGKETALLTGPEAGEGAFKRMASGHRVVHLATHGFFLEGRCASALESARRTAQPDVRRGGPSQAGDNPLLLSGLALAGANRREEAGAEEEDGILTAEEIAAVDLSGVEWAVLSGCETGVGQVHTGEGVLGLRRAFQTAGAGTLIMSLWSVEDAAAREWMKGLYEGRLGGMTTAEAARAAGIRIVEARRKSGRSTHPFFWAAFVAAGDWR